MTQTATDNVEVMKALYEAFGRGDVPTVINAMDDGIEWHQAESNPSYPGHAFIGPQQVLEGVFARLAEFEDLRIEPHRFIDAGDTVVVQARYRASSHQATGKPLDVQGAHVWDLRDGKVVRFQQYIDTRRLSDVMGVSTY